MAIYFTHPYYLFLIVILPIIVFLHFYLLKIKKNVAVRFSNFDAIARIRGIDLYSKNLVVVILAMLISFLAILSISGLQYQQVISSSASSYVIAIDTSQSMQANDLPPSRIEVAKKVASGFVDSTPAGTKVAIITFSGSSFLEQDLTDDKELIKNAIDNIQLSSIGGTDIREAIISGTNVLAQEDSKSMILMSDGRLNVGDLQEGLDYATKNNVIIHTIGLGTDQGGQTSLGLSKIEEDSLKSISFATGGQYFRVKNESDFVNSLDSILKYKLKNVTFDLTRPLMIAVLILVVLQYILVNTRYKSFP